jgi:hypothetical protein
MPSISTAMDIPLPQPQSRAAASALRWARLAPALDDPCSVAEAATRGSSRVIRGLTVLGGIIGGVHREGLGLHPTTATTAADSAQG